MENRISAILEDIKRIEDNKKEVASKYGIQSNKAAEIEKILWGMANVIRREDRNDVSDEAFRIFNAYWDYPASSPKLRTAMEKESVKFIRGYMEYIRPQVEKTNRWGRSDNRLTILNKILMERQNSTDDKRKSLIDSLLEQTSEFKSSYIYNIATYEESRYDYFVQYKEMRCWSVREWDSTTYRSYEKVVVSSEYTGEIPQNLNARWLKNFKMMKLESQGWNKDVYMEKVKIDAERDFNNNIEVIADRIIASGMKTESVKVSYIGNDAKFFEMYMGDGEKRMHCRSIFCAEYSVLVEPHWRFIITNA